MAWTTVKALVRRTLPRVRELKLPIQFVIEFGNFSRTLPRVRELKRHYQRYRG